MSRQLEQLDEERTKRERLAVIYATSGGLESAVDRAGGELVGMSVRFGNGDVLLTLRAKFPAGRVVGFVGAETLGGALRKAVQQAKTDQIRWKTDTYVKK